MAGLLFGRFKLYLVVLTIIGTLGATAYWYYKDSQLTIKQYVENQATLEAALSTQSAAYEALKADLALMQQTQEELIASFNESRTRVSELEQRFEQNTGGGDRDLGKIAAAKPDLVQKIVNTATHDVFRCFELLSGNTPTTEDLKNEDTSDCTNSSTNTDRMQ